MLTVIAIYNSKGNLRCQQLFKKYFSLEPTRSFLDLTPYYSLLYMAYFEFFLLKYEFFKLKNAILLKGKRAYCIFLIFLRKQNNTKEEILEALVIKRESLLLSSTLPLPQVITKNNKTAKLKQNNALYKQIAKILSFANAIRFAIGQNQWSKADSNLLLQHLLLLQTQLFLWHKEIQVSRYFTRFSPEIREEISIYSKAAATAIALAIAALNSHNGCKLIIAAKVTTEKLAELVKTLRRNCQKKTKHQIDTKQSPKDKCKGKTINR